MLKFHFKIQSKCLKVKIHFGFISERLHAKKVFTYKTRFFIMFLFFLVAVKPLGKICYLILPHKRKVVYLFLIFYFNRTHFVNINNVATENIQIIKSVCAIRIGKASSVA